jgi:hypothetical protein
VMMTALHSQRSGSSLSLLGSGHHSYKPAKDNSPPDAPGWILCTSQGLTPDDRRIARDSRFPDMRYGFCTCGTGGVVTPTHGGLPEPRLTTATANASSPNTAAMPAGHFHAARRSPASF